MRTHEYQCEDSGHQQGDEEQTQQRRLDKVAYPDTRGHGIEPIAVFQGKLPVQAEGNSKKSLQQVQKNEKEDSLKDKGV